MEVFFLNSMQTCRWPIFKGHSQRTLDVERAYRRRRPCLSLFECPSRSPACAVGGNVPSGRRSTFIAAAAPTTSGTSRTETTPNGAPPSSPSSPSSLLEDPTHSHPQQPQPRGSKPRFRLLPEDLNDRQLPEDNPSLDDIVLDEQYYREMGLTEEDVQEALWQLDATEVDPEGLNLSPGAISMAQLSTDVAAAAAAVVPEPRVPLQSRAPGTFTRVMDEQSGRRGQLQQPTHGSINGKGAGKAPDTHSEDEEEEHCDETDGTNETKLLSPFGDDFGLDLSAAMTADDGDCDDNEVYGPEAVVLAGFRPEEHGLVRALLDTAGGHVVKVLPVTESMLYGTVDEAVHLAEQDWAAPRAPDGPRGGSWGSQRTVLFAGLGLSAQLTFLELLESSGFPAVCATAARCDLAGRRLGEVLAEAVADQRSQTNRISWKEGGEPWRAAAAATGHVADGRGGLAPLEELIGHKARDRLRQVDDNNDHDDNGATPVYDKDEDDAGGGGRGGAVPTLNSVGREAAASAEAEWEAWRVARNAAAAAGWGIETDDGVGRVSDKDPDPDPDSDLAAVPTLADMGVNLEQLREQVLRQLSEMDPETLDELLVDSPYGYAAEEALAQWRRVQADDGGQDRPVPAVPTVAGGPAAAAAAAAGRGLTADETGQLAEWQRQRWQKVKESLETAAAAAGQLVMHAESSLLQTEPPSPSPLPPPSTPPSPPPPQQQQQFQPVAPSIPFPEPVGTHGSQPAGMIEDATAAASAAAFSAPAHNAVSRTASGTSMEGPVLHQQQSPPRPPPPLHQQPVRQGPAPPAPTPTPAPAPTLDVLYPLNESPGPVISELNDLLGLDDASVVSELDDLLGKLTPATSTAAAAVTGVPPSLTSPLSAATPLPSLPFKPPPYPESGSGFGPGKTEGFGTSLAFVASGSISGGGGGGGGGVLQQVQEAARSGTAPEAIQKMLDERYGVTSAPLPAGAGPEQIAAASPGPPISAVTAAAAATTESNPLLRRPRGSLFAGLKSGKSASTSSSAAAGTPPPPPPEGGKRLRPRRSYGPAPPPAPDPLMKPLLDLRPDIARAVQEKKVQFMDLSRLNDKQKRHFVEHQARQRLQQQAQQQERQLQHLQQQQQALQQLRRQQKREGSGLEGAVEEAAAAAQAWPGDDGQKHTLMHGQDHAGTESYDNVYDGEEDTEEYDTEGEGEQEEEQQEDDDQEYGTVLDAEKLQLLVEASQQEGLSLEETLAQAVAMGVRLPEAVLQEAGVSPPSEAALVRAREEYDRMFQACAAEEGLAVGAAQQTSLTSDVTDPDTGSNDRHLMQRAVAGEYYGEAVGSSQASATWSLPGMSSSSTPSRPAGAPLPTSRHDGSGSGSSSGSRPWGAGLAAKRRRSPGPSS